MFVSNPRYNGDTNDASRRPPSFSCHMGSSSGTFGLVCGTGISSLFLSSTLVCIQTPPTRLLCSKTSICSKYFSASRYLRIGQPILASWRGFGARTLLRLDHWAQRQSRPHDESAMPWLFNDYEELLLAIVFSTVRGFCYGIPGAILMRNLNSWCAGR